MIIKGKELLAADAKRKGYSLNDLLKPEWVEIVCKKFAFKSWDALCSGVGYGGLKEGQVINRFIEEVQKEAKKAQTAEDIIRKMADSAAKKEASRKKRGSGVVVKGVGDVSVRFSHCCNPVPGDEIVGFVTRGRGVSIHRTDCINIINLDEIERHRLIDAEWDVALTANSDVSFTAEVKLICTDRNGLIMDVSRVLSEENLLVKSFNGRSLKDGTAVFNVVMQIGGKEQLDIICRKFLSVKGVDEIERVTG